MEPTDDELQAVRRPFDAAIERMCQAQNEDQLRDELSNALNHLYRLSELCCREWGIKTDNDKNAKFNVAVEPISGIIGALWVRHYDTHEIFNLAKVTDLHSDFVTELYGVLTWKPFADIPIGDKRQSAPMVKRQGDYKQSFHEKPVLDTLRRAFDELAKLRVERKATSDPATEG